MKKDAELKNALIEKRYNKLFLSFIIGIFLGAAITYLILSFQIYPKNERIFNSNIEKVVEIRCSNDNEAWGFAAGCFIDSNGMILTNKHVVSSGSETIYEYIEVRTAKDNDWQKAKVLKISDKSDLAIIKVELKNKKYFKLANSVKNGEKIYTIGNPNGYGLSFLEGVVSNALREVKIMEESRLMMQASFVINSGNSGGPVFNTDGKLVGLMSFRLKDNMNEVIQGVSFAVPISEIKHFIESL